MTDSRPPRHPVMAARSGRSSMLPPSTPVLSPARERALLIALAGIQFTHILDFMVMMPLGPQFTRLFNISDAQFGMLVSAYTLSAGASGLLAAFYVDRFDRQRLLLALYAGFALATLACGLAPTYGLLMGARIAAGAFGGVMGAMVQTLVADFIPFERRGRAMGVIMGAFSLSTVAGVPASLWMAGHWGWHAPFIAIALMCVGLWVLAARSVPRFNAQLAAGGQGHGPWAGLREVLSDANHWRAFGLSVLIMLAGFAIIPYITIFSTTNVGVSETEIPLIYLAGGVATLFTSRLWGALADRWGKVRAFRLIAALAMAPMLLLTHLGNTPLWMYIGLTTMFFVFVSGRMVPGMAIIASAAQPRLRGTFMSLQSCVQSAAMGVASFIGGVMISRSADGQVLGYGRTGWLAVVASLGAVWLVGRIQMHQGSATTTKA